MALLPLADLPAKGTAPKQAADPDLPPTQPKDERKDERRDEDDGTHHIVRSRAPGLHYNIEIHLPATKDVEVYNAIFKSLREHIIGK